LTGTFRAEISTPIVPDGVLPCTFDFTQTGTTLDGTATCLIFPPLPFTGTINPTFGFFSVGGSVPFICPTLTITGIGAANSYTFTGFFTCADGVVPVAGSVVGSRCANGIMDPGETCEDGNWTNGDCCSSTCQLAPNGNPCTTDGNPCTSDVCNATGTCTHPSNTAACDDGLECTTGDVCGGGSCHGAFVASGTTCTDGDPCTPNDACDGAGTCVPAGALDCGVCMACVPGEGCSATSEVATSCGRPVLPKARLQLKHGATDATDQTKWKFAPGEASAPADFGTPNATTDYRLCVFEQSSGSGYDRALLGVSIPAGSGWTAAATGFKYKSKTGTVRAAVLKAGAAGKTRVVVKAKGAGIDLPALPVDLSSPVLVQLQSALGECWQSEHGTAAVNSTTRFTSKTGSPSGAFVDAPARDGSTTR
jgi:cysteine-rich repeat protein